MVISNWYHSFPFTIVSQSNWNNHGQWPCVSYSFQVVSHCFLIEIPGKRHQSPWAICLHSPGIHGSQHPQWGICKQWIDDHLLILVYPLNPTLNRDMGYSQHLVYSSKSSCFEECVVVFQAPAQLQKKKMSWTLLSINLKFGCSYIHAGMLNGRLSNNGTLERKCM